MLRSCLGALHLSLAAGELYEHLLEANARAVAVGDAQLTAQHRAGSFRLDGEDRVEGVTAGADASIKLWDLSEHAEGNADDATPTAAALETFASHPPGDAAAEDAEPTAGVTDSKGEYVRALALAAPDVLFVATNRGVLHLSLIHI